MAQCLRVLCALVMLAQITAAQEEVDSIPAIPMPSEIEVGKVVTVHIDRGVAAARNQADVKQSSDCKIATLDEMGACVVEVRSNGTLVIEGCSERLRGNDVYEHTISGEVPAKAIHADGSVQSKDIANLRLRVRKRSTIQDVLVQPTAAEDSKVVLPTRVRKASDFLSTAPTGAPNAAKIYSNPCIAKKCEQSGNCQCNCEKCDSADCSCGEKCEPSPDEKMTRLWQKLRELDQLQAEVRQLRTETGTHEQPISVKVQMVEVSLSKLRRLSTEVANIVEGQTVKVDGIDGLAKTFEALGSVTNNGTFPQADSDASAQFIKWLKDNNIAKVVAEPTVVTMDGRPASLSVGGEIPIPTNVGGQTTIGYQTVGTQLDILPVSLGNKNVRVDVRARIGEPDYKDAIKIDGAPVPRINVRQCAAAVETKFGKSIVLNGIVEKRTEAIKIGDRVKEEINEIALIFVVTPTLLNEPATVRQAQYIDAKK